MATNASAANTIMYLATLTSPYILTSGNTWDVPVNLPPGSILSVECWAAGSGGTGRVASTFGAGGAGGAWVNSPNYIVSPNDYLNGIPYSIGAGSVGTSGANSAAGGNTSFSNNNLNALLNTINSGAVVGTPGTLPFNWNYFNLLGLSSQVVGFGTTSTGYPYLDIRLFGTSTGGATQFYASTGPVTVATWNFSHQVQLVGGSLTNITSCSYNVNAFSAASAYISTPIVVSFTPTTTLTSYSASGAMPATTATAAPLLEFDCVAGAIDITFRAAAWQFELGSTASPWKATATYLQATGGAAPSGTTGGLGTTTSTSGYSGYSDAGGNGAAFNAAGAGGGGAGGLNGVGANGTIAGVGGQGNATTGGLGGAVSTVSPAPAGSNNVTGGGGGGSLKTNPGTGGAGGFPGGGGGAAVAATGTGGAGAGGQIKITYLTPSKLIYANPTAFINITPTIKVMNPLPVNGTNTLEILTGIAALSSFTNTSATDSVLGISSTVSLAQYDQVNATCTFNSVASAVLINQFDRASLLVSFASLSPVIISNQTDLVTSVSTIESITCISALQIPYPASGVASLETLSATGSVGFQEVVTAAISIEILSASSSLASLTYASGTVTIGSLACVCSTVSFTQSQGAATFESLVSSGMIVPGTNSSATNSFEVLIAIGLGGLYDLASTACTLETLTATASLTSYTNASGLAGVSIACACSISQSNNISQINLIEVLSSMASLSSLTGAIGTIDVGTLSSLASLTSNTNASSICQFMVVAGSAAGVLSTNATGINRIEALTAAASLTSATSASSTTICEVLNCSVALNIPLGATTLGSILDISSFGLSGAGTVLFCRDAFFMTIQSMGVASQSAAASSIDTIAYNSTASMINPPPFSAVATIINSAAVLLKSFTNASGLATLTTVGCNVTTYQSNTNFMLQDVGDLTAAGSMASFTNVSGAINIDVTSNISTLPSTNALSTNTIEILAGSASLTSFTNVSSRLNVDYNVLGQFGQNCFVSGKASVFTVSAVVSMSSFTLSSGSGQLATIGGLGVFQLRDLINLTASLLDLTPIGQFGQLSNTSGLAAFPPITAASVAGGNSVGFGSGALLGIAASVALGQNCPVAGLCSYTTGGAATAFQAAGGTLMATLGALSVTSTVSQLNPIAASSSFSFFEAQGTMSAQNPIVGAANIDLSAIISSYIPFATTTHISIDFQAIGLGHNGYTSGHVVYWDTTSAIYSEIIRTQVMA